MTGWQDGEARVMEGVYTGNTGPGQYFPPSVTAAHGPQDRCKPHKSHSFAAETADTGEAR